MTTRNDMPVDYKSLMEVYFQRVNSGDHTGIATMYASQGRLLFPDGNDVAGPEAVESFYEQFFQDSRPAPCIVRTICDGQLTVAELEVSLADGSRQSVVDVFQWDTIGQILELSVFSAVRQ